MRSLVPLPSTQPKMSRVTVALLVLCLVAASLRIPGLFTDFWGDEIWSWSIAGQLHSIVDVLTAAPAHIDNNHLLNTLWLYLIGQHAAVWLYRLPALLAGAGSVLLAAWIMLKHGQTHAIIAVILFGFSYPLIFYSSEARGYSFAVFFSLLSFCFLENALSDSSSNTRSARYLYGLATILGFLSHLTFLHIYAGAVVWSLVRVRRLEPTTQLRAVRLLRLHAIPLTFLVLLFRLFVRGMVIGGAAPTSPGAVFLQTLSMTAGGPGDGWLSILFACFVSLLFVIGLLYLAGQNARENNAEWMFFLVAVVISPAMACIKNLFFSERPQPLMLRYFLVCVAMLLLSITPLLANIWQRGTFQRLCLVALLVTFVVGNLLNTEAFLQDGRGHYGEAIADIAEQVTGPVLISSDNPLRASVLVQFYGPRVAPGREVAISSDLHQWLILNRSTSSAPDQFLYRNNSYNLVRVYTSSTLSGWNWDVYHRVTPPQSP